MIRPILSQEHPNKIDAHVALDFRRELAKVVRGVWEKFHETLEEQAERAHQSYEMEYRKHSMEKNFSSCSNTF